MKRKRDAAPPFSSRLATVMAILAVAFLSFLAGNYVMYQRHFPADSIRRAFAGGIALYDQATGYNNPYNTPFWNPARTAGRGVLRNQGERTSKGLTLYSSGHAHSAFLVDMDGNVVHEWTLPYSQIWEKGSAVKRPVADPYIYVEKAYVYPNGDLLALFTAIGDTPWGYGLVKVDSNSKVIWKYLDHTHHDFDVADDGSIYVLTQAISDVDLPNLGDLTKPRIDDFVVKLSPDGQVQDKLWLTGAFAKSRFARRLRLVPWQVHASNGDYLHTNSVQALKRPIPGIPQSRPGQVLVSLREVSMIGLADFESQNMPWATTGPWSRQHAARVLDNGHIMLFDNEGDPDGSGLSRVLEFDPATFEIAWKYSGTADAPLESVTRSSESRLENGNTMIVESEAGRILEVSPEGDIVWEFVNPVRDPERGNRIPIIFWSTRIDPNSYFTETFRNRLKRSQRVTS